MKNLMTAAKASLVIIALAAMGSGSVFANKYSQKRTHHIFSGKVFGTKLKAAEEYSQAHKLALTPGVALSSCWNQMFVSKGWVDDKVILHSQCPESGGIPARDFCRANGFPKGARSATTRKARDGDRKFVYHAHVEHYKPRKSVSGYFDSGSKRLFPAERIYIRIVCKP